MPSPPTAATSKLTFYADFTKSGVGAAPSSAPTIAVYSVNRSTGAETSVVAAGTAVTASSMTGRYFYQLSSSTLATLDYHARFTTSDLTADSPHVPALWTNFASGVTATADGGVNATAWAGTSTVLDGDGYPSVNAIEWGGVAVGGMPNSGAVAVSGTVTLAATQAFNNTGQTTNLPADVQTIKTQTVTAAAGVTFPSSIGTSTYAGGAVASVTGSVGSVATGVTVSTNNDKTGYVLATAPPTAAAIAATILATPANLLVTDSSGRVTTSNPATAGSGVTEATIWAYTTRTLSAGTNIVLAKGTGLTGLNDIAATAVVSGGAITTSGGKAAATVASGDDADAASVVSRLTSARAGYLDNLNVGGVVASHADVLSLNTATGRAVLITAGQYLKPASSSTSYPVTLVLMNLEGVPEDADGASSGVAGLTTVVTNGAGTDRSSNFSGWAHGATGRYEATYSVASGAADEPLVVRVSGTVGSQAFVAVSEPVVADAFALAFNSTDRTNLAGLVTTVGSAGAGLTSVPYTGPAALTDYQQRGVAVTLPSGLATASQIPANFTSATFASAGVFSTGALANAPTGGSAPTVAAIRTEMDTNSTKLANLDVAVSSRSTYAGGAVASVTAPVTQDLTQPLTDVKTGTVGGALNGAWSVAWGKVAKNTVSRVLSVWGAGNTSSTPSATFLLDDATSPTTKTPQ